MVRTNTSIGSSKLYRCPPSPQPSYIYDRERSFVLDGVAVSTISKDYAGCNPKLGTIIPPYNGQKDPNALSYFKFQGVRATLSKSQQSPPGTPIEGIVEELFFTQGSGFRYLSRRNTWGCGHSHDVMSGHAGMFSATRAINGYNGEAGFRRNTPALRQFPSSFDRRVTFLPQLPKRGSAPHTARSSSDPAASQQQRAERKQSRANDKETEQSSPEESDQRSRKSSAHSNADADKQ